MDDLHVLAGRERTQEEFFHGFNRLIYEGAQLALACSPAPDDIPMFSDLLKSRMMMGLVFRLPAPTETELQTILSIKFAGATPAIFSRLIQAVCQKAGRDTRRAEGLVKQLLFARAQSGVYPEAREIVGWLGDET